MRSTLRSEVYARLEAIAPAQATAPEIGIAVRARRDHVDECLRDLVASGAVEREEHPGWRVLFRTASRSSALVPSRQEGGSVSDVDFLLAVLADGKWHTHAEILARSFRERGVGLTIHSRAAEARRRGNVIENETTRSSLVRAGAQRAGFSRAVSSYRLVARAAESAEAA